jgi:hypothetical protein
MQQHEIPTHLDVEDKALVGLTMRQLLMAAVAVALAYGAADQVLFRCRRALPSPLWSSPEVRSSPSGSRRAGRWRCGPSSCSST